MGTIRRQQDVLASPSSVKHLQIRHRDWIRIRDSLEVCRPPLDWTGAAGWAAMGGGVGGVFAVLGLAAANPPMWLVAAMAIATVACFLIGYLLLRISEKLVRSAADRVSYLRVEMNAIEAECDQEQQL